MQDDWGWTGLCRGAGGEPRPCPFARRRGAPALPVGVCGGCAGGGRWRFRPGPARPNQHQQGGPRAAPTPSPPGSWGHHCAWWNGTVFQGWLNTSGTKRRGAAGSWLLTEGRRRRSSHCVDATTQRRPDYDQLAGVSAQMGSRRSHPDPRPALRVKPAGDQERHERTPQHRGDNTPGRPCGLSIHSIQSRFVVKMMVMKAAREMSVANSDVLQLVQDVFIARWYGRVVAESRNRPLIRLSSVAIETFLSTALVICAAHPHDPDAARG